jgi:hypothetical protein
MKILIQTNYSSNVKEWNHITSFNKLAYCNKWGYSFQNVYLDYGGDPLQIQNGQLKVFEVLKAGLQSHDAVMLMGCDTVFTNFARKIEDIIKDDPRVVVAKEHFGMDCVNNDVMIFPKGKQSSEFIEFIINKKDEWKNLRFFWQTLISNKLKEEGLGDLLRVVGARVMNSCAQTNSKLSIWQKGDWVFHAMGWEKEIRLKLLTRARQLAVDDPSLLQDFID